MDNFWKPFFTLFGIGAAISFAKSMKSKKPISEVLSEMIIHGFFATGAAAVMIFYPAVSFLAIAAIASLGAILGIAFFSERIQAVIDSKMGKKDGPVV